MSQIKTKFLASHAVTSAKFRQSSGLSVVGVSGTSTADVADITGTADQILRVAGAGASLGFGSIDLSKSAAVGSSILANSNTTATSANTASTIVARDSNNNFLVNTAAQGVTTTATAGTTTTLTVSSTPVQQFTGTTTQNLVLPDATTLSNGFWYSVLNASTGAITVKNNGGTTLATVNGGSLLHFMLISNGSSNGTWDFTGSYGNSITSLTSDVTASGPGAAAATIASHAVSNSKLAQMGAHTYKGNNTGSTADAADITSTQLTADLNQFTSSLQGLVPGSGGGTTNFLRADGTWAAPSGGGGSSFASAVISGTPNSFTAGNPIIFPTVDYDSSSAYNNSTGKYTAPNTGTYLVTFFLVGTSWTTGSVMKLYVNNSFKYYMGGGGGSNNDLGAVMVRLTANDTLYVSADTGSGFAAAGSLGIAQIA